MPGIRGAGLSSDAPLTGGNTSAEMVPLGPSAIRQGETFMPAWRIVDSDYFKVMGIPLKAGRFFTDRDSIRDGGLIVSEGYAKKLWPAEGPSQAIGRQMRDFSGNVHTIIGVVGDVRNIDLSLDPLPVNYRSSVDGGWLPMNVVLRTEGSPAAAASLLREQVRRVDPTAPVFAVLSMEELIDRSSAQTRWNTLLVGGSPPSRCCSARSGLTASCPTR